MQEVKSWSNGKCLPPKSISHEFKYGNQLMQGRNHPWIGGQWPPRFFVFLNIYICTNFGNFVL